MSSLFLANELLDMILGNLNPNLPGDRKALLSCALVNNTLRIMSQQRVFRRVRITYGTVYKVGVAFTDSDDTNGPRFLDIINTNPAIKQYVEEVTVQVILPGVSSKILACSDRVTFSMYGILSCQLRRLRKFSMVSSSNIFTWCEMDQNTRLFLRDFIAQVQHIDFTLFQDLPASLFWTLKRIRHLRVQNLYWDVIENEDDDQEYSFPRVKLESLDIGFGMSSMEESFEDATECFFTSCSPFDLSHLRSLTFSCSHRL
ncbi:hypothetical protein CVT26_015136 [Gymnopilus dilepis]|uniref:F-box domain-containing protein n=1 Tax=Gymnopilus dilepis TaxID=231916 RepID=A0A409YET0_9AGAR|nr:hypothetical protein CVT26_015136 [Gymnopilus dilepis]